MLQPPIQSPAAMTEQEEDAARRRTLVARGRADVAAGRTCDHADVEAWLRSWGSAPPLARPQAK